MLKSLTSLEKLATLLVGLLVLFLLTVVLLDFSAPMQTTNALFTDQVVITGNTFSTGSFIKNALELSPGTSKATYVTRPGPFPPIASLSDGELSLDFGEIPAGNSNNSSDVFHVKNLSNQTLTVELKLSDNLVPLFSWVRLEDSNNLAPGQEKRVEMKLDTSPNTSSGIYTGSLTVSPGDGYLQKVIPIQIAVLSR